jgi:hypothetical protein
MIEYNGFLYLMDDSRLVVVDAATHRITVDMSAPSSLSLGSESILGNGNLLVIDSYQCDFDCDYRSNGYGYRRSYTIIDVKTGEMKDVRPAHTVDGVEYRFVIREFVSNYSSDQQPYFTLKDTNHLYAEINWIVDGVAQAKSTSVILDSELKVVEVLDNFVLDQTGIDRLLKNGNLVIKAGARRYSVDMNGNDTEKVQAYVNADRVIEGGFVENDVLYNDDMKPLVAFNSASYGDYYTVYNSTSTLKVWCNEDDRYVYMSINDQGELVISEYPEQGTTNGTVSSNGVNIYHSIYDMDDGLYDYAVYNTVSEKIGSAIGTRTDSSMLYKGLLIVYNENARTYYTIK